MRNISPRGLARGLCSAPFRGTLQRVLKRLACFSLCFPLAGCGLFLDRRESRNDAALLPDAATRDAGMDAPVSDASVVSDALTRPDSFRHDAFVRPDAFALPDSPDAFVRPEFCNGIDDDGDGPIDEDGVCTLGGVDCEPIPFGGHTYILCDADLTWEEARDACTTRTDFHLVKIESVTENDFVAYLALGLDFSRSDRGFWDGAPRLWIGLRNQVTIFDPRDDWRWADGGTLTLSFWKSGEPNGSWLEACGEMRGWRLEPGVYAWNDSLCSGTRAYLCERDSL